MNETHQGAINYGANLANNGSAFNAPVGVSNEFRMTAENAYHFAKGR